MAVIKYKTDYFLKDFDTIRSELISRVPIISEGRLTDLNESSTTVTLIELFAAVGDMLGFYLDSNALEAFLPTVRQPENVYRHAHLIGYTIREKTSARVYVKFTLGTALTGSGNEVFIPKGTQLGTTTASSGMFTTRENTTIPVGRTESEEILAIQGQVSTETFTSSGAGSQYLTLGSANIDPSTIDVYTGRVKWSPQESFLYSKSTSYDYVVETDYAGVTRVYFGDGKFGRAPSVGEIITVTYLVTQGIDGNVGAGAVALVRSPIYTLSGIQVSNISVTNPEAASGGAERQSLEHVKLNAPGAVSALYRPMTKYDYIALIERISGVQHANVWGEQEELSGENGASYENMNWANVCICPVGGGLPTDNLKATILEYLIDTQPITVRVRFIDPEYIGILADLNVYVESGYSLEDIRIQITDAVRVFFDLENVRFGQDIRVSSFYKLAMAVEGVDHVTVNDFGSVTPQVEGIKPEGQEVILQKWQIPTLDTFDIDVAYATEYPIPDLYPDEQI